MTGFILAAAIGLEACLASSLPAPCETEGTYRYEFYHPEGVMTLDEYSCATFSQRVEKPCIHRALLSVTIPSALPQFTQLYPVADIPEECAIYLKPSQRIQSDDASVAALADEILESARPRTEAEAVAAVLVWTRTHITHALPDEVPDAVTCLKRRTGNCIGFTHVAAALLRHMGIPARTVRMLVVCPECGKGRPMPSQSVEVYNGDGIMKVEYSGPKLGRSHLIRHSVVEVYFPQDGVWALFDPQTAGPVSGNCIYLRSHTDWDVETQRACRAFSSDARTVVTVLDPDVSQARSRDAHEHREPQEK